MSDADIRRLHTKVLNTDERLEAWKATVHDAQACMGTTATPPLTFPTNKTTEEAYIRVLDGRGQRFESV